MADWDEVLGFWYPPGFDATLESAKAQGMWWMRGGADDARLETAIREAITRKPKGHDFDYSRISRDVWMLGLQYDLDP